MGKLSVEQWRFNVRTSLICQWCELHDGFLHTGRRLPQFCVLVTFKGYKHKTLSSLICVINVFSITFSFNNQQHNKLNLDLYYLPISVVSILWFQMHAICLKKNTCTQINDTWFSYRPSPSPPPHPCLSPNPFVVSPHPTRWPLATTSLLSATLVWPLLKFHTHEITQCCSLLSLALKDRGSLAR